MKLKLLDLFSGIGGFSLGLESTGYFETIGFVEKDEFCQKVLKKNFNNIPIESEVRNVKGDRYKADIITGGFPCQPFSVAGKRRGTEDDRYLWDETIRVIRECKPRWFIGENVEGIINIKKVMVFDRYKKIWNLEKEGFEVQCVVIPASGIGAWHQRKRVWIIAHSNSNRDRIKITGSNGEEKEIQGEHREKDSTSWKFIRTNTNDVPNSNSRLSIGENKEVQARGNTINSSSKNVSNSDSGMCGRWGTKQSSRANEEWRFCFEKEKQTQHDIRSKTIGCDAIFGETKNTTERSIKEQQTWWEAQSKLCRTPNGISYELDKDRKNRIKSLGNSIVPLIARELGLAIMKAEQDG